MPLYPAIKLMDTVITPDAFDFTTKPTAPEPGVWDWHKKVMDGHIDGSIDVKPELTTEPTTAEGFKFDTVYTTKIDGSGDDGSIDALAVDPTDPNVGRPGQAHVAISLGGDKTIEAPAQTDDCLLLPAVQTGGVSVACGDVNGDTGALGDPITFTYTVNNTSSAYEGTHALYQDVVIPSLDTGPALAIEEITIAHEGIWL